MNKDLFNINKEMLVLATAGSVDDGKSTLIGRLFYDLDLIYEDHLQQMREASEKKGLAELDLSLLTDGLAAEREQGITIDVAYRFFDTKKKRVIIADVPGHEQYTRNMVTGASNADVALVLVDARNGMTTQSRRHLFISSLLGISHIVVVVNKMDAVGYDQKTFEEIKDQFLKYSAKMEVDDLQFIPVSALKGDMVVERGDNMPWYEGDTLLYYLENVAGGIKNLRDFRLPIQYVIRPNQDYRGFAGKIESGIIRKGEKIKVLPSGASAKVESILMAGEERDEAFAPQSVAVSLDREIDISRGDMMVREDNLPHIAKEFEAMVCWFDGEKLNKDKTYLIKQGSKTCRVKIDDLKYRLNIDTLHREGSDTLELNDIGRLSISANDFLMFDPYAKNRRTGNFILIDELSKATVAAGVIIDKGTKKTEQPAKEVEDDDQGPIKLKKAPVLWFTGLSGSGKSTIAAKLFENFKRRNVDCEHFDGDVLREIFGNDLGFTKEDRMKNIERVGYLAKLLNSHRITVLATFIT
ncbi:adenylyl-sulfate kinase, partial [Candidatus Falkowbacteria bacterium]|nr:adenylyl-sulfate kinase [Candidatus Falkowbacteria bacterium]